jgi:hypothetical protein
MERVQGQQDAAPPAPSGAAAKGHIGKSGEGAQSVLEHLIAQEQLRSAERRASAPAEGEPSRPGADAKT